VPRRAQELDTTLQVLGIDGSAPAPPPALRKQAAPGRPPPPPPRASSGGAQSPGALARAASDAALRRAMLCVLCGALRARAAS